MATIFANEECHFFSQRMRQLPAGLRARIFLFGNMTDRSAYTEQGKRLADRTRQAPEFPVFQNKPQVCLQCMGHILVHRNLVPS